MAEGVDLGRRLIDHIRAQGPIGFDEYVANALYAPGLGFYTGGGGAGRRRDFLTSPEVGPLFGAVMARALDTWWADAGRPDPFTVIDAGAGPGSLARSILAAEPRCGPALRLVLVEVAEHQWATHPEGVVSRPDLPGPDEVADGPVVVLTNELLDNLPFGLVELLDQGWCEVLVRVDETADGGPRLAEGYVPLEPKRAGWCWGRAGRSADVGARMPVQAEAAVWLAGALDLAAAPGGRVVAIDYTSRSGEMARRPSTEWLRTYARHGRGTDPLDRPGHQDITVEVAVDQLATVRAPDTERTQARFLADHGLADLVAEGRERWARDGVGGGLAAVAGRSRVHEADALTDPSGLGNFTVLEWRT